MIFKKGEPKMVKFKEVTQSRLGEVNLESGGMYGWEHLAPVLRRFAQKWRIFVSVTNRHGDSARPLSEDRTLYIRFYSNSRTGPNAGKDGTFLPKAYNIRLRKGDSGDRLRFSGAGEKIISQPEKKVVAEVVEKTLFVHFNLPYVEGPNAGVLMERILESFENSSSFVNMKAEWEPLPKNPTWEVLNEFYWNKFQNFFLEGKVFGTSERIIRERFEELKNAVESHKGSLGIADDKIVVSLGPVKWSRERDSDNIGCYDFVMYPRSLDVRFHHTTPKTHRHHTVGGDGGVCLGNVSGSMQRFIRDKEFDLAVALAYEFLKTG